MQYNNNQHHQHHHHNQYRSPPTPTTSSSSSIIDGQFSWSQFDPIKLLKITDNAKVQIPSWIKSIQNTILDLDFFELVRNIGQATSREQEARIIKSEITRLKTAFSQSEPSKGKKREYLMRMIYCHMLGYDVPFGHVHALNMTQDQNILSKRTGYLTLSLCLPEKHELLIMVVNSIQKGLGSTNYLEVSSALTALSKLVDTETIPAFMPKLEQLLSNSRAIVRKKAVTVLHRFYSLMSTEIMTGGLADKLRMTLCDKDPSVMAATLNIFLDISKNDIASISDLVPSFVSILKQVAEGRLPEQYIYHGVHHPWLQVTLLKLLANLGHGNKNASEHMYQVILFTMQQSLKFKNNAGFAILYESIRCLNSIEPNISVIESSSKNVSILLSTKHNNLRYLGIKALASIVKVSPKSVAQFQIEVIECLESSDETLKRKSFDLLYRMTNHANIVPIVVKLMEHLQSTTDSFLKVELVSRILDLADRYSPNDYWYIDTITSLLCIEESLINSSAADNLIRLIAEGTGEENREDEDNAIKLHAVHLYSKALSSNDHHQLLPDLFVKVLSWVISEYTYLNPDTTIENSINLLCDMLERDYSSETKTYILLAITKLTGQIKKVLPHVTILTKKYINTRSLSTQQRALELLELSKNLSIIDEILPIDAYCEEIDTDSLFTKLDSFTRVALNNGAKQYVPYQKRKSSPLVDLPTIVNSNQQTKKELKFIEYPAPIDPLDPSSNQQPQPPPPTHQVLLPLPAPTSLITIEENKSIVPQQPQQPQTQQPQQQQPNQEIVPFKSPEPEPIVPKPSKIAWTKQGFVGNKQTQSQQQQQPQTPTQINQTSPTTPNQTTEPQTSSPNKNTPPQQQQTKKQIDPEKEKLAQQLFGGLVDSTPSDDTKSNISNRLKSKKPNTPIMKSNPNSNDLSSLLVDLESPSSNQQTTTSPNITSPKPPQQQPIKNNNSLDPLLIELSSPSIENNTNLLDEEDTNILTLNNNTVLETNNKSLSPTSPKPSTNFLSIPLLNQISPDGDSIIQRTKDSLFIEELPPKLTVLGIIKIELKKVGFNINLNVSSLNYMIDSKSIQSTQIQPTPIEISDFLGSNTTTKISKEQFEKDWKELTNEKTIQIDKILSQEPLKLSNTFTKRLNLCVIHQDKEEMIAMTKLFGLQDGSILNGELTLYRLSFLNGSLSLRSKDKNLCEMLSESEQVKNQNDIASPTTTTTTTTTSTPTIVNSNPTTTTTTSSSLPVIKEQQPTITTTNNNSNNQPSSSSQLQHQPSQLSITEKRKSRLSHHDSISGGFDYLDTLLNDMSDESIRNSIKSDNSRIKSLRLTSTFDLETTLKDLEETFFKDNSYQNKRKPSSHLSKQAIASAVTATANRSAQQQPQSQQSQPSQQPTQPQQQQQQTRPSSTVKPIKLETLFDKNTTVTPSPQPPTNNNNNTTTSPPPSANQIISPRDPNKKTNNIPPPKRESTEKSLALTREAIDAADLLDQLIDSFGTVQMPTQAETNSTTPAPPANTAPTRSPNSTLSVRPAAKLNAPVDIQMSSPKPPTPIATLSSPPISPNTASQNSDKLLDEMISIFKESNTNLKMASSKDSQPKPTYLSQQHYTQTIEEQQSKIIQKPQAVDEDLVQKILGDNEIDIASVDAAKNAASQSGSLSPSLSCSDKQWYIKGQSLENDKIIGFGNYGTTSRAGVHKDKRLVCKSWNYITPQATPLLFNEIEQLISIKHPNILPLIGASFDSTLNTFTEYKTGNNLDIVIKNVDEKSELPLIIRLAEEIASAVSFLHSFNIVHRSLHPKNILLNSDLKVYIKDYGFASLKDETLRKKLMTPLKNQILHSQYISPELFNVLSGGKGGYDTKVDVFSFGVILWEMFARDIKLTDLKSNTVNGYTHYLRPSPPNCPFTIEKLIRLCISTDPTVRPSFQTILKVLRQPLHTLQRYNKPAATDPSATTSTSPPSCVSVIISSSSSSSSLTSSPELDASSQQPIQSPPNESLDNIKREKIQKIYTICKDLIDSPTFPNLNKAAQTIETMAKNPENYPYLLDTQFIPLILQLMDNRFEDIHHSCLRTLSSLVENDELSEVFRNLLGINLLIQCLASTSENILFATLRLLSQLCRTDVNRLEVMSKGGINILINLLSHTNELIRLQVIWCITMLLESTAIQDEFIKMGGVELLIDLFVHSKNNGFDLRVASALSRVISTKHVQDLINNGHYRDRIFKKYLLLLSDKNFEALRMLGLEAIACLITNKDNQELVCNDEVLSLFLEYLNVDNVVLAPQMTALKVLLVLSVDSKHIQFLKSKSNLIDPLQKLQSSPHPSIQKAAEKISGLISSK
eukprot:gene1121-1426_t